MSFQVRRAGVSEKFKARAGSALIFPSGFGEARFSYDRSEFQTICVELDPARVRQFLGREGPAAEGTLSAHFGLEDAQISALLSCMAAEVAEGCPAGKLYGESLSLALAAYLEGRFSVCRHERIRARRFSESQVQKLVDFMRANIASDLSPTYLADLLDMSPRQFFRLFASTFGSTPHRYVMKERVARASKLLSAGLSLAEIANALGFANQSHFTDVFRKMTGVSPGRFRQENAGAQCLLTPSSIQNKSPYR